MTENCPQCGGGKCLIVEAKLTTHKAKDHQDGRCRDCGCRECQCPEVLFARIARLEAERDSYLNALCNIIKGYCEVTIDILPTVIFEIAKEALERWK